MIFKNCFILSAFAFSSFFTPVAYGQSRAGSGGINLESMQEAACLGSVRRLDVMVTELEDFANELQACNDAGQVYNGVTCVDVAKLEHEWFPSTANPTQLILRDNGTEVTRIGVIRGSAGADATCPVGTVPTGG